MQAWLVKFDAKTTCKPGCFHHCCSHETEWRANTPQSIIGVPVTIFERQGRQPCQLQYNMNLQPTGWSTRRLVRRQYRSPHSRCRCQVRRHPLGRCSVCRCHRHRHPAARHPAAACCTCCAAGAMAGSHHRDPFPGTAAPRTDERMIRPHHPAHTHTDCVSAVMKPTQRCECDADPATWH